MKGVDPRKNTRNTRGKHKGNTGKTQEKSLKPTRFGHTYARFLRHKEIHDPNQTKDDT